MNRYEIREKLLERGLILFDTIAMSGRADGYNMYDPEIALFIDHKATTWMVDRMIGTGMQSYIDTHWGYLTTWEDMVKDIDHVIGINIDDQ